MALGVFSCHHPTMASIISGKIKILPSGLASVVFSHAPAPVGGGSGDKPVLACSLADRRVFAVLEESSNPPLGSRAKVRQNEKAGYGTLGNKVRASWKSGRNVRERMSAIESEYGVANCGLLTVTLPSTDPRAFEALARYSSYAMDRLNREINRYFGSDNIARVSVWEYQKRGALHCHLLIANDCIHAMKNDDVARKFSKVWFRILQSIEKKFDCNMFLASDKHNWVFEELLNVRNKKDECVFVNFQKVRKSVVAYLSKYLADSNHENDSGNKNNLRSKFFPVATWFQWNRKATELYNKYLEEIDLGTCEPDKKSYIESMVAKLKDEVRNGVRFAKDTEIKEPKNPYNIGLYWLPEAGQKCQQTARIITEFIVKIAYRFRPRKKESAITMENLFPVSPISEIPYEVDLAIREHERNSRLMLRESAKNLGDIIAFDLIKFANLIENNAIILEDSIKNQPKQLELFDYV